ncbi:MAG: hypothetical protein KBC73_06415 [Burkholderiaceae bacterium]|nr:hypothetical protein [Burkholderiaceae bacterium]
MDTLPLVVLSTAGALLLSAGLAWATWALLTLQRAGARPGALPPRLIDEGPFARSRHPLALGAVASLAGLALALGSPTLSPLLLLADGLLLLWLDRVLLPRSEARQAQRFGGWWRDYAADVRRWL